jgi:SAM-dependent methyltransferase
MSAPVFFLKGKQNMDIDPKKVVISFYKEFLSREPDKRGLDKWSKNIETHGNIDNFMAEFLNSDEVRKQIFSKIWKRRTAIYEFSDELQTDVETLTRLFEKTATYWKKSGSEPSEVYFSVLSSENMKKILGKEEKRRFLETGKEWVEFCVRIFREISEIPLEDSRCIDFGCGVGRLSIHAAPRFREVIAADFSAGHLAELRENVSEFAPDTASRVTTVEIHSPMKNQKLPKAEFCFSYITLQHNTPPVMAYFVSNILDALTPGGVAVLHIPIHHPFYDFRIEDYLSGPKAGQNMEMHILPRENLKDIALRNSCTLVDSFGFGGTRGVYSEVFAFRKD